MAFRSESVQPDVQVRPLTAVNLLVHLLGARIFGRVFRTENCTGKDAAADANLRRRRSTVLALPCPARFDLRGANVFL
jgi:hypothetical protein